MGLPRRLWAEMTTEDFGAVDRERWIAVLPIAAVEQHGPHLPVGVDAMIMEGYLERLIPAIPADIPVTFLPLQPVGKSNEHVDFPGTLSLSAETAAQLWRDIGDSVARSGLRKLLILNSHGGNMAVMDVVARDLRVRHGMLAAFVSWHLLGYPEGLYKADELRLGIHAGAVETSLMLAFRPDLVRQEKVADFRPASYEMEARFQQLRTGRPAGFGWMAQDLHPSGAAGDAAAGSAAKGEACAVFGVSAFIALLRDIAAFDLAKLAAGPLAAR
jgi:creatinine amidohydrolase